MAAPSELTFGWGTSTATVRPHECPFVPPRFARKAARLRLSEETSASVGGCALLYVMHDPDAPTGFVHWITVRSNVDGTAPAPVSYMGPSPPAGEVHTYYMCVFRVPLSGIRETADALRKWFRDRNERRDNFSIKDIVPLLPHGTRLTPNLVFKFKSGYVDREGPGKEQHAATPGAARTATVHHGAETRGNGKQDDKEPNRSAPSAKVDDAADRDVAVPPVLSAEAARTPVTTIPNEQFRRNVASVVLRHYAAHTKSRRARAPVSGGGAQ